VADRPEHRSDVGISNRPLDVEEENQERVEERKEDLARQPGSDRAEQNASPSSSGEASDTGYLLDTGQGRV